MNLILHWQKVINIFLKSRPAHRGSSRVKMSAILVEPIDTRRRYGSFDIITQTIDILALLINVSGKRNGKILAVKQTKNIPDLSP